MYNNRNYLIIPVSELSKVDFNQVLESSPETLRKSIDGTKTFIKWDSAEYNSEPTEVIIGETGETQTIDLLPPQPPSFVLEIENSEGPYNYEEILEILTTSEWNRQMEEM